MLEINLLGQFEVLLDGRRLIIPTRNAQSLFAYLILNAGQAHRREQLAGLLWPDSSEDNARSNLRHELWRLRKALEIEGQSCFRIDELTIAFAPPCDYSLDAQRLASVPLEGSRPEDLIAALSLYRGQLLPGFYDEWVFAARDRLQALFEARMARLLELLQAEERWAEVLDWAMRWIALGEWPEPAYRALMSAYANHGDLSKAVATYERFRQGLHKDLGVEPSQQTQALLERLKAGEKIGSRTTQAPVESASAAFALPRLRRSNLPRPLTSFIGREKEIRQVEQLISGARLVTITGPGGVGKTRLAIQAASALAHRFRDGVWWVELAPLFAASPSKNQPPAGMEELPDMDLVAQAVAKALRIPETPGLPLLEGISEYLRDQQLLLALDNCEHLIAACAALAEYLLGTCLHVSILATSREALGVPGEKAWLLPSLSLPEEKHSAEFSHILQSEAVSLFIERAGDMLPGYQPGEADAPILAQICQHLDGIPLAIELAAARMSLLSAQEIATRLDSRFSLLTGGRRTALPRHQTLRAAIEWSYDLLSEAEQMLFRRLSVFASSFTLEAAEAVCTDEVIRRDAVLTLLGRLADKSLLRVEPVPSDTNLATRYRFLDTICSFGRLKLDETGEIWKMRDRHADYYVRLAEAAGPVLLLQNQARWFKLLQAEYDNMRSMIEWGVEKDQAESALRAVAALFWFWWLNGFTREGRDLALKALALPSAIQFKEKRAQALSAAGFFQLLQGDTPSARQMLEEALLTLRSSNDEVHLAWSLQFLGLVLAYEKEYSLADTVHQESLAIIKRIKDVNINNVIFFMGDADLLKGDISRAKKTYEENATLLREMGSKSFLAYPLRRLGYLALEQNDFPKARSYFLESLSLNHEVGDMPGTTACLASAAALAIQMDKLVTAARLFGAVESQVESLLISLLYLDQAELGRIRSQLLTLLDEAAFAAAFSEGWEMSDEQAIELAQEIFGAED